LYFWNFLLRHCSFSSQIESPYSGAQHTLAKTETVVRVNTKTDPGVFLRFKAESYDFALQRDFISHLVDPSSYSVRDYTFGSLVHVCRSVSQESYRWYWNWCY